MQGGPSYAAANKKLRFERLIEGWKIVFLPCYDWLISFDSDVSYKLEQK